MVKKTIQPNGSGMSSLLYKFPNLYLINKILRNMGYSIIQRDKIINGITNENIKLQQISNFFKNWRFN